MSAALQLLAASSTPSFSEFDPADIPWQEQLVDDVFHNVDYSLGRHEFLLSGSVGSGKSLPAAHCALRHLLTYSGSKCVLARRAMPDLRDTIFAKLVEHLEGSVKTDGTLFREGRDYGITNQNCKMWFRNGSRVISRSWADGNYKKLGSVEASIALVEELTENGAKDEMALKYLRMRVGRLPHVPQSWIMYMANPDAPSHFAYDYFQIGARQSGQKRSDLNATRHVYFSRTEQNPFLPAWYIEQLKRDMDPKLARRMLYGEWVEITTDVIYHAYSEARNFRATTYTPDPLLPIYVSWDFNIGQGKPLSLCLSQVRYEKGSPSFHFYAEVIIEGASTEEACEELGARGLLDTDTKYIIHGDATGAARSTQSKRSNYDIIAAFLGNYRTKGGNRLEFEMSVPKSNPPVRTRHNLTNAYCRNEAGMCRVLVYAPCATLNKGLKLTALKKGGQYIENDGPGAPWQHVTTAAGYHICRIHRSQITSRSGFSERKIR